MDSYAVLAAALCFIPSLWSFHWSYLQCGFGAAVLNNISSNIYFGARQKLVAATELREDFKLGADLYV